MHWQWNGMCVCEFCVKLKLLLCIIIVCILSLIDGNFGHDISPKGGVIFNNGSAENVEHENKYTSSLFPVI